MVCRLYSVLYRVNMPALYTCITLPCTNCMYTPHPTPPYAQNAMLPSSDRGGMRIQFSKNPFGRKRDVAGNLINTPVPGALPGVGDVSAVVAGDLAPGGGVGLPQGEGVGGVPGISPVGVTPPVPE